MNTWTNPTLILLLFLLVRCADLAYSAALGRDYIRVVAYGLVAILALLAVIVMVFIH